MLDLTTISDTELLELKKRLSFSQLARRFSVSTETMKRKFKKINSEKDAENTVDAIDKLLEVAADVPVGFCRQQIHSAISQIREHSAKRFTVDQKKSQILKCVEEGEAETRGIVARLGYERSEIEKLLDELIEEKRLYRRERGSHYNKGRKTKYLYFIDTKKK